MTVVAIDPETIKSLEELPPPVRRDLARSLHAAEAKSLVRYYYAIQKHRVACRLRAYALGQRGQPALVHKSLALSMERWEQIIQNVLDVYSMTQVPGQWARSVYGIGPVLASGLLAYVDPAKAKSPSAVWRFAGLDPTLEWERGQRRPYCSDFKVLCWRIGESFVKFQNRPKCYYGRLYAERKEYEAQRNQDGAFADQAKEILSKRRFRDSTTKEWYERGMLSPGHISARARRWVVKLFLAHYWQVAYEDHYGEPAPKPYVISRLGHADYLPPPGWPMSDADLR